MSTKSLSSPSLNEEEVHVTSEETKLDENSPRPRLCHLKKWPDFQGYGFNLHAERAKLQQHIGKVDPNSPAESAGLKEGDRIIEVNYVNISNENHQQVVRRIRNGLELNGELFADQVVLLVLDPEADEFFKKINTVVKNDLPSVLKLTTTERVVKDVEDEEDKEDEQIPELTTQPLEEISSNKRMSNCSSVESEKIKSDDNSQDNDSIKVNSLHNSNSDLNNNRLTESLKEETLNINKTSTNSASSLNHSQERSPLNQSKQSNSSSAASSPAQSQNSTLNRTTNTFPKDEIFSIKAVHEMLQASKSSPVIRNHEIESRYEESGVEFRRKDTRPPRPPPPGLNSYRASTISTFTQAEQLDRFLEMSAAEFKNYLKAKGRNDPRIMTVDMKRKHEIFQNM